MTLSLREKFALGLGATCTIFPSMIVAGFMPLWDVLPFAGWLTIATLGSGIAGAIGTPRAARGAIAGGLIGGGALLGLVAYTIVRYAIIPVDSFLHLELAIGACLGAIPGWLLYDQWARHQ